MPRSRRVTGSTTQTQPDSLRSSGITNSHYGSEYGDSEQDADNESGIVQSAPTPTGSVTPPGPTASRTPTPAAPQRRQRFACQYCPRAYSSNGPLDRHIQDRHCGTRCYFPGCGRNVSTEDGLLEHFRDHQKRSAAQGFLETECPWPNCGKAYSRRDTVQRCIKRHNREARGGA
ncbi:hypothetical protein F5Y01DRAFT_313823 [Xylaria sp. FL0043]|nr:hypothetical protein F5Y01DRAFT_313823 [Xylaria sp. FL0043]